MKKLVIYSVCAFLLGICIVRSGVASEGCSGGNFAGDLYGAPQTSIDSAKEYVKKTFFYSTKKGDNATGETLPNLDSEARRVATARSGYYQEVVSAAFAHGMEASTAAAKSSLERAQKLLKELKKASTYDKKKAVEVVIMQNEIRERIQRMSLELEMLELEVVDLLIRERGDYIIPRTAEQMGSDEDRYSQED